jgi:hypothetical protein
MSSERDLVENLMVAQIDEKFLTVCGTQWLITVLTRVSTETYLEPDESSPHPHTLFL